ncbi:MAG TPA: DUF4199 domain-containing protein [Rhizomicrobium sp.]|jgi:hypothetical protein|nr:DUF4199 domain-containing protein [Rhizomicrobium sp.]
MIRIALVYGLISGAVIAGAITATIVFSGGNPPGGGVWLGYAIMLVALSAILVGVKQYRDAEQGGVIGFWRAFGLGVGIAIAAGLAYVLVWEGYEALTHYAFMDRYIADTLAAKRAAGVSGAEYQKLVGDMEALRVNYRNPLYRMSMTFAEIFPVGLLVALASAALLRNPRFLPARAKTA